MTRPLLTESLSVYGPPGRRIGAPATWGPWVLFPTGSHTRGLVVAELRRLGAPIEVVAESHQPEVLQRWCASAWAGRCCRGPRPRMAIVGSNHGRPIATRALVLATRASAVRDPAVDLLVTQLGSRR